jgi:hypothetical protein
MHLIYAAKKPRGISAVFHAKALKMAAPLVLGLAFVVASVAVNPGLARNPPAAVCDAIRDKAFGECFDAFYDRITLRSNSAIAPTMENTIRPAAVVVSMDSGYLPECAGRRCSNKIADIYRRGRPGIRSRTACSN